MFESLGLFYTPAVYTPVLNLTQLPWKTVSEDSDSFGLKIIKNPITSQCNHLHHYSHMIWFDQLLCYTMYEKASLLHFMAYTLKDNIGLVLGDLKQIWMCYLHQ